MATALVPDKIKFRFVLNTGHYRNTCPANPLKLATPSNILSLYGSDPSINEGVYRISYLYFILLDNVYNRLLDIRKEFKPKHEQKKYLNMAINMLHSYFTNVFTLNRDTNDRLLDYFDECQELLAEQLRLLYYEIKNYCFREYPSVNADYYTAAMISIAEVVHAGSLCDAFHLEREEIGGKVYNKLANNFFNTLIPSKTRFSEWETEWLNRFVVLQNPAVKEFVYRGTRPEPIVEQIKE